MSTSSNPNGDNTRRPSTETVGGIPVSVEVTDYTVRPAKPCALNIKPRADLNKVPTVEDLAGIPACVEDKPA